MTQASPLTDPFPELGARVLVNTVGSGDYTFIGWDIAKGDDVTVKARWMCADGMMYLIPDYIPDAWLDRLTVVADDKGVHFLWTGWNNGEGHGKFKEGGKTFYTHRRVYETVTGRKLKRTDYVDHLCERKSCCTFECLEPTTPGINTFRASGDKNQFRPKEKLPEVPF